MIMAVIVAVSKKRLLKRITKFKLNAIDFYRKVPFNINERVEHSFFSQ